MDTLKGEWTWVKASGGIAGTTWDNQFTSIVKILSQNEDSSINCEVWVEDTLSYQGSFQFQNYIEWDGCYAPIYKIINIKLPHPFLFREICGMRFTNRLPRGETSYYPF